VADLQFYTATSGQYPTQGSHFATKDYVVFEARDIPINTRTANYTLTGNDEGKCVEVNSSSGTTVTVPTNASVDFPIGTRVWVRKMGTGNVGVVGASGVTINWVGGNFTVSAQYSRAELHKRATDTWVGFVA
jgi:hypothetical protein